MSAAPVGCQEERAGRRPKADAEFVEPFSQIDGVRELRDGRAGAQRATAALADAVKDPTKFTGQKACWIGRNVGGSISTDPQGRQVRTSNWMGIDDKKFVVPEQTFVVDEAQLTRTDAAKQLDTTSGDSGDRLLCGTIAGAQTVTLNVGATSRSVPVPLLKIVTIDAPPPAK